MDEYIGQRLDGRYEIKGIVGEGGMANVYKAEDLKDHRTVAVKILKDEFTKSKDLVRRFKNESRAISVLSHPNIVKVFDVSVDDKVQYIVMEYIDGITLKEYIEQRGEPLTYREVIHFIPQVLLAIQHAHDKGVVHRDIKPQNIMLMEDGNLKVMDFGIARLARSEVHTATDQAIGSVHYISPEQAKGDSADPRADIYSVGIMMYEMLAGRLPFESDNAVTIAIKQISDEAKPLHEVNPSVPQGLEDITLKAMAKEPRRRYQNALDMLRDIEEFKRDPSVRFEYEYMTSNEATRIVERVMGGARNVAGGRGGKAVKKKQKKRMRLLVPITAGITVSVVAICAFLCWTILVRSGNPLFTEYDDIELPNFHRMMYDDVMNLLNKEPYNHLRLQEIAYESNDDYPAGMIISQNPTSVDGKKKVKANQRLYLTVSEGIKDVTIPDLTGMTRGEATQKLRAAQLKAYVLPQVNQAVPIGQVFSTDPPIGSVVKSGTVVRVFIASKAGDYTRTVPNLVGLQSAAIAQQVLAQQDMNLGSVREEFSDRPVGEVTWQSAPPNEIHSKGFTVSIRVSKGPDTGGGGGEGEMAPVPGVSGMSQADAEAAIAAAGFVPSSQPGGFHSSIPAGHVIGTSPGGEAPLGSTVTLLISQGPDPALPPASVPPSVPDPGGASSEPPPPASSEP